MLRSRVDIPLLWYRWLALVIGTVGYWVTIGSAPLNLAALVALGGAILYALVLSIGSLIRRRHLWPWYITAALDIVSASALIVLTGGVGSPFLPYYLTPVLVASLWGSLQWAVGGTVGLGLLYPLLVALSIWGRWGELLGDPGLLARFLVSEGLIFLLALLVVLLVGPVLRWREQESELAHYERLFALSGAERPRVLAIVTEEVLRTLPADVALIFLRDPIRERLELHLPDPYPMMTVSRTALQRIEWDQAFLKRLMEAGSPALSIGEADDRFPVPEAVRNIFLRQPFLAAPLVLEGETIGLMLAGRRQTHDPFPEKALNTMADLSSRVARVLGWTESLYNLQRRYTEMSALNQVLRAINSPRRLEDVLQRIVQSAREVLQMDRVSVMLLDDNGERLRVRAVDGIPFARPIDAGVPVGEGISGRVAREGMPLLIKLGEATRYRSTADREVREALCLPLQTEGQTIGVLNLSLLSADRSITPDDVRLAQLLADAAAVAIAKADLIEKVFTRTHELSQVNRDLAAERHRLVQVIGGIVDGVVVLDATDRIALWNRAALQLLDLPEEELRGVDVGAYLQEQGLEELHQLLRRLRREAPALSGPLTYRGPLSREDSRIYEVWVNPFLAESEGEMRYDGAVAVMRDVTVAVEEERVRADFVSTMVQDIRTPLTAIKGYLELLANGEAGAVTSQQGEFLARSKENIDRCVQLLNDFLDLSRIHAGELALYFEPVNVGQVVQEAVDAFQASAQSKQIELRAIVPPGLPLVVASHTGLRQVLVNLVDNALKHTSAHGQVLVRVEDEERQLKCYVQDTGVGIPAEMKGKAFARYGESGRGVGLGLYIAKQVVEAHGGTIGLESEPGKGTVVFFTLPKDRSQGSQRENQGV